MQEHLRLTREQLYELAWSKPMTAIAKSYGVSDRAMAKLCGRQQVPVPPRGYWAMKSARRAAKKSPLLPFIIKKKPPSASKPKQAGKQLGIESKKLFDNPYKIESDRIKKFRQQFLENEKYTAKVHAWSLAYRFGLNAKYNPFRPTDASSFLYRYAYEESCWVYIEGELIEPKQHKGKKLQLIFIPSLSLNKGKRDDHPNLREYDPPQFIGTLQNDKSHISGSVSLPYNALNQILLGFSADKIKFVTLLCEKFRKCGEVYNVSIGNSLEGGN